MATVALVGTLDIKGPDYAFLAGRLRASGAAVIVVDADDLVGGVLSAGPDRLTAAGAAGLPQVIAPGALDTVNFARAKRCRRGSLPACSTCTTRR